MLENQLKNERTLPSSGYAKVFLLRLGRLRWRQRWHLERERSFKKKIEVDANDIEALKLVSLHLEMLLRFELVEEGVRGWRWIKNS